MRPSFALQPVATIVLILPEINDDILAPLLIGLFLNRIIGQMSRIL